MNVYLLYRDQDFDVKRELPPNTAALTQDLELNILWNAMAQGDAYLFDIAKRASLLSLRDPDTIRYRQQALRDCLNQPTLIRRMYAIAVEALQAERKVWSAWAKSPDSVLTRAVQVMSLLLNPLRQLRQCADDGMATCASEAFTRLFRMLGAELSDEYLQTVKAHLRELTFPHGALISAELGQGGKGKRYTLRRARQRSWTERLAALAPTNHSSLTFTIPDRDQSGFDALAEIRGRGINQSAHALTQAVDHIVGFFALVRAELAFYLGCLNLRARLETLGAPTSFPTPAGSDAPDTLDAPVSPCFSARELYDVCLALQMERRIVANDVNADGKTLIIITGANQGGKSTFLRSVGVAYLMAQCGMFAPAAEFRLTPCAGLFTHYKREEDAQMRSGKLDEELGRMREIADLITPAGVLLCNESFASTNEREGSEIGRQVIGALTDAGVRVLFVTHLYDLAQRFARLERDDLLFLRAERHSDGQRTFRLVAGEPLPTSFGEDVYHRVFAEGAR